MMSQIDPRSALAMAMVDPIQKLSLFPNLNPEISMSKPPTPSGHGAPGTKENQRMEGDGDNISSASATNYLGPNLKREARATIRLLGLILLLCVTWMPYFMIITRDALIMKLWDKTSPGTGVTVTTWMFLISSAANPIVYAFGSRKFRHAVKRLWRRRKNCTLNIFQCDKQTETSVKPVSINQNGRLVRSKSVPTTTSKTAPITESDTDTFTIQNNNVTPPQVVILSAVEEVTTPKNSRASTASNYHDLKFDAVDNALPSGNARTSIRKPRRLPPLKGLTKSKEHKQEELEMVDLNEPQKQLPCLQPILNEVSGQRRSSLPE